MEDALERASPAERRRGPAGAPTPIVVLDPPRQGCPPAVVHAVFARLAPGRAVYVSCNPEALAEELPAIVGRGYRIVRVQPVDMFPHTAHIETVVTLDRRPRPTVPRGRSPAPV